MNKKSGLVLSASAMMILGVMVIPGGVSAENSITISPLDEKVSLQRTTTTMSVPSDNTLPWGTVGGAASDYAERYPVIIQFYQNEDPVHFAQVDVRGDGSYEYKFRVGSLNYETGEFENFYQGDYTVKIFRVIPNDNALA